MAFPHERAPCGMSSLRSDTLTMRVTGVRITVFCIDVIVHCHTAGALFESNGRKQLSLSSCGWVLILSGQFIITPCVEYERAQPLPADGKRWEERQRHLAGRDTRRWRQPAHISSKSTSFSGNVQTCSGPCRSGLLFSIPFLSSGSTRRSSASKCALLPLCLAALLLPSPFAHHLSSFCNSHARMSTCNKNTADILRYLPKYALVPLARRSVLNTQRHQQVPPFASCRRA